MKTKCPKCGHLFAATEMASKGGRTSAARLTPLERRARARAAARARWAAAKPTPPTQP